MIPAERDAAPVGDLLKALAHDTGELVRQEVRLASTEMTSKAKVAARSVALIGAGGALAQVGLAAVLAAIVIALAPVVPLWAASLVAGVVVLVAGYVLIRRGATALQGLHPIPEQTVATLRADGAWTKEPLR
jgi:uncharacterized membrane protein YqjE